MRVFSDPGGGSAVKVLAALAVVLVAVAVFFMLGEDKSKEALSDARTYIMAVQKRDFDTIFRFHGPSQRRRLILVNRAANKEEAEKRVKELYNEQKKSFDEAPFTENLYGEWVEKYLFVPGADIEITGVEMVPDTENPSQPLRDIIERINAIISVKVTYKNKDSAPDIDGKIKSAVYRVKMVHSDDVARTLRRGADFDRWLFMSVSLKEGSVTHW